jgi:choline dehydrogenase-like flavoprotein
MLLFPESYGSVDALGVRSVRYLMDRVRRGRRPEGLLRHLRNVVADLDDVAGIAWRRLSGSEGPVRVLENTVEQPPDPENRVTLSGERDRLGKNRVVLSWRFGDAERRTLARVQEIIGEELGRAGLGRLQIEVDADPAGWQNHAGEHHMGATRMHVDPRKGVVDADCRVHDVGNLFIAGSSVFPTSGYANPTLTIVALAIRLADHLKARMA